MKNKSIIAIGFVQLLIKDQVVTLSDLILKYDSLIPDSIIDCPDLFIGSDAKMNKLRC